jgi:hypothetical protein
MNDDVTGKDDAITAQAIAIAATHREAYQLPRELLSAARVEPLALYIAVKYLQSLPEDDDLRIDEYAMKAILLGRYADFVERAVASDPSPPNLVLFRELRKSMLRL